MQDILRSKGSTSKLFCQNWYRYLTLNYHGWEICWGLSVNKKSRLTEAE